MTLDSRWANLVSCWESPMQESAFDVQYVEAAMGVVGLDLIKDIEPTRYHIKYNNEYAKSGKMTHRLVRRGKVLFLIAGPLPKQKTLDKSGDKSGGYVVGSASFSRSLKYGREMVWFSTDAGIAWDIPGIVGRIAKCAARGRRISLCPVCSHRVDALGPGEGHYEDAYHMVSSWSRFKNGVTCHCGCATLVRLGLDEPIVVNPDDVPEFPFATRANSASNGVEEFIADASPIRKYVSRHIQQDPVARAALAKLKAQADEDGWSQAERIAAAVCAVRGVRFERHKPVTQDDLLIMGMDMYL